MKSHVSLEAKVCPVCEKTHKSGAILLDRRLKDSLERETVTGFALCPEHTKEGFTMFIVADKAKSRGGSTLTPQTAYKTGDFIQIRNEAAKRIFSVDVLNSAFCYITEDAFQKLREMTGE